MKKSNALMFSYIIFLFITLFAQMLSPWDGLDQIAMAATIAGVLFAIADYYGWQASFENTIYTKYRELTDSLLEYTKFNIDTIDTQDKELLKVVDFLKPREDEDVKIKQCVSNTEKILSKNQEVRAEYEKTLLACDVLYSKADAGLERSKRHQGVEAVFGILAFISFFAAIAFDYLVLVITPYQAIATVFAFAIIMLNYYMKDVYQTKKENEVNDLAKMVNERKQKAKENNEDNKKLSQDIKKYLETFNSITQEDFENEQEQQNG